MIAAIELAILARAKAAGEADVLGYKFGTKENYPEDWEAHLVSSTIKFPAIYANFASFDATDQMSSGARVTATFGIVVAARSSRNKTAVRHGFIPTGEGKPAEPGSLQLMEDIIGLMQRQKFGLEITPFELIGAQVPSLSDAVVKAGVSLLAMQWRTSFIYALGQPITGVDGRALGDFTTFNSKWDVSPVSGEDPPVIDLEAQLSRPIIIEEA